MDADTVLVVPADIDDPALVSGGNVYDRRVLRELGAREVAVGGDAELARALSALPDGSVALLDGLVACGAPEAVVPQARRLRLVVLVHLPLGVGPGSSPGSNAGSGVALRERAVLGAAAAVVATSPWTARWLSSAYGLERVVVAAPGVDPAPVAPCAGHRLLCVGALTPTKGQDVLAAALAQLSCLRWSATLVGPTRRDPRFAAGVRRAVEGLDVRLTGPLLGAELAAEYAAADLLVLPSRTETYGMVVTEALARGIPVLASDVGGVPETLGGGGLLVPPDDAGALAAALRRWLTEPALRAGLRRAALARRPELPGWDATAAVLDDVLRSASRVGVAS